MWSEQLWISTGLLVLQNQTDFNSEYIYIYLYILFASRKTKLIKKQIILLARVGAFDVGAAGVKMGLRSNSLKDSLLTEIKRIKEVL